MEKNVAIPVIGLVGGIGSGKSYLSRALAAEAPVALIDADKIGHEVLTLKDVKEKLQKEFGDRIFRPDGEIDRRSLGILVFGQDEEHRENRKRLERIVHPVIRERIQKQIAEIREAASHEAILLDAAILLESGWRSECQAIIYVEVPVEERIKRVISERNWTSDEFFAREANQLPVESKRNAADFTVINFPAGPAAVHQIRQIYRRIKDGFSR